jgi:predicted PurR-regulated permease PerM
MSNNFLEPDSTDLPAPWDRIFGIGSRLFVWGALFGILYLLRSFFLLIFLTFIFAYIQAGGVAKLSHLVKSRTLSVVLVGIVFLGVLISLGLFLFPRVKDQAGLFASKYPTYVKMVDGHISDLSVEYPFLNLAFEESTTEKVEFEVESAETQTVVPTTHSKIKKKWDMKASPTAKFVHQFLGLRDSGSGEESVSQFLELLNNIGRSFIAISSAFLLALLFSFLIVLDLPRLTKSVTSLERTKLRFIYEEVAYSIKSFATVIGRTLSAQVLIAFINTLLTAVIILYLGVGSKLAFLSVIVFLCGFIPVAGVFISSVPICLVVLQEVGLNQMLLCIMLIWLVHMIEAYILNPRIFGEYLRINPVLVLIILTVGGKLFHVWGLVLGLPICKYIFGEAIRNSPDEDSSIISE